MFQSTMPDGSPITVSAPPQLADITMAQPSSTRCRWRITTSCMMVSIITVVVRLSRLAEIRKVTTESVQSMRWLLRVRSSWDIKSKHPLFCSISTITIVASRKSTISEALPTYLRNTL